ncbi:hypothetical protein BUY46_09320 [Staphylococcus devriesei]|nr:hypothetical protein BUY46_09320 [Staphylococcus devriesei]
MNLKMLKILMNQVILLITRVNSLQTVLLNKKAIQMKMKNLALNKRVQLIKKKIVLKIIIQTKLRM